LNRLRVLHVIGGDDTGGAMSYLLPLLTGIRAQGCDAQLLCLGAGGLARAAARRGLPYAVLPMSHPYDVRVLPALRRHITSGDWQVVHTHGMRANLPARVVLTTVPGRPLLFTSVHSDLNLDYSNVAKSQGYALINRLTRAVVDGFCCVSDDLARRLVENGVPRSKIHVVHPGIELPHAVPTRVVASSPGPGGAGAPGVVGTVARLVPVKDLGLLLDSLALLQERVPDARALIVGDGPERHRLERRAAEKGLSDRVEFLGQVRRVWPALARFDVFVMTSEYEGVPISVLEAMAMGLPVVATAVGGVPEAVREGVTGFLVKRDRDRAATAAALAARIAELLLDRDLRERMGEAGRRRVAADFSSQAAARTMLAVYARAIAARPAGGVRGGPDTEMMRGKDLATPPRPGSAWPAVTVLGFRLDLVGLEEAARWVMAIAGADVSPDPAAAPLPGRTAIAVSFNPELVMEALKNSAAAEALRNADLSYPDGVGAVWAARHCLEPGSALEPGPERVAGIDLAQRVLELAAATGAPVYFLGGRPGVAEEAARRQRLSLPGLQVAGSRDGYFSSADEASVVAAVRAAGAAILFVAMGAPKQETLLYRRRDEWGAAVALGVGGSFDVWAGETARAPDWVRRAGVEWLYRLVREPRRLQRQLVLPRYVYRVLGAAPETAAGGEKGEGA
jgi:exopolysaccharide biosynthesis WecB/TagA/CpsF family protein